MVAVAEEDRVNSSLLIVKIVDAVDGGKYAKCK